MQSLQSDPSTSAPSLVFQSIHRGKERKGEEGREKREGGRKVKRKGEKEGQMVDE